MSAEDIVQNFANTLQNQNTRPSVLYGRERSGLSINKEVKVKDVITIISKQLQAIKNADCVGKEVRRYKTLCLNKKSDIVPVNITPVKIQSETGNKFETQYLDTQLLNLIDNQEALINVQIANKETDTTLSYKTEKNKIKNCNKNAGNNFIIEGDKIDFQTCKNILLNEKYQQNIAQNTHNKNKNNKSSDNGDENRITNDCINADDIFHDSDHSSPLELEAPNSPILKIVKSVSKPQPLICTLEEFDKFESLAAPLLNGNTDFEDAKRIISSQIKATDMFHKRHSEIVTMNEEIKCRNENVSKISINKTQYSFDINSGFIKDNVIEDEMLFDSDDDIKYTEELPLTCALETSFYNNSEVLDRTMYVGFQTASNQSIQILSDSFKKAKTVFDNISKTVAENLSITELVEAFDRKTSYEAENVMEENNRNNNQIINTIKSSTKDFCTEKNTIEHKNVTNNIKTYMTEHLDENIMREFEYNLMPCEDDAIIECANKRNIDYTPSNSIGDKIYEKSKILIKNMNKNNLKRSGNNNLIEFKTGNNKKIRISDQALSKTKHIFGDMEINNLENNFNLDPALSPEESYNDFVGFKTTNNKNIKISVEAVLKTKKDIFGNIDKEMSFNPQKDGSTVRSLNQNVIKSQPVINSSLHSISMKKMKRCSSLTLKETHLEDAISKRYKNKSNDGQYKVAKQLRTDNRKTEVTSDEQSQSEKSKHIYNNFEKDDVPNRKEENIIENELYPVNNKTCLSFKGFKTANNKPIKISDEALLKTKMVFQDIENENKLPANGYEMQFCTLQCSKTANEAPFVVSKQLSKEPCFEGFQTASHKSVEISEEALLKSRKIFEDIDLNNKDKNSFETRAEFKGFCTASNKRVKISEEALLKSRKIFEDIDLNNKDKNSFETRAEFKGYCTASNKRVKISEEALLKSRKIFEDIDLNNKDKNSFETRAEFKGYCTASNKRVKISEEALLKSRKIFEDIDLNNKDKKVVETRSDFKGFCTASNKIVKISEEALMKSKKIFEDIDLNNKDKEAVETRSDFKGFCTASNKSVKISEEALMKSKKIFEDIDLNNKDKEAVETRSDFKGFCTASNKSVKISEEALLKSKKIFEDIDLNNKDKEAFATRSDFKGFCTASNKSVKISEEALLKSKKIFEDIDLNNKDKEAFATRSDFKGFCTASNKSVKISEEALLKSKKIFEDIDLNNKDKEAFATRSDFKGFCTASNKSVKISEEALMKSKKIFEDIDLNNKNEYANETASNIGGICTTSTRREIREREKINISEEAVVKSKENFENTCDKTEYSEDDLKKCIKAKLKDNVGTNVIKKLDIVKQQEINIHEENKITENNINVDEFLNTEMIKIFDESLHTEDFFKSTTPKSKRSGSPILSCSKTKKKKFEAPKSANKIMQPIIKSLKPLNLYKFEENYKKLKKYKLTDIVPEKSVNLIENIDPYIFKFHFDTLLDFRFESNRNDIDSDTWTTDKIKKYFIDSVQKKIIPEGWIDNHMKLIIWKLISYEAFSPVYLKYACSVKNVLQQLKYRYDRELYNVERPALRKILEKDDISTKSMILCVASLYVDGVSVRSVTSENRNIELLLTDGWYCVKTSADPMIDKLIIDGKISIGTKLAIHGAELTNCEQGISPWEDTSAVRFKISGNSTKRAKWDARLGFHGNGAMKSRLNAVTLEGGKISKLRVFVTRVYPTMYVEKFEDGSTVTRSERLEHLHQMKYETERQIQMEKLYEEVVKISEQESDESEEYTEQGNLDTGSQISRLMKKSKDPLEFKAHLTSSQAHMLNEHTDRQNEKLIQTIQNKAQMLIKKRGLDVARNVVPLMKVRVFDERKAMITIWRPNESLLDLIKEGAWIDVYNVVPTSIRYSEIQISAGRQSIFCHSTFKEIDKLRNLTQTLRRKCYAIKDLQSSMTTDYNEVDTVGIVFLIEPKDYDGAKELFQNVYLSGIDKSLISVNFWGGVKKFGFENILEVGQIVACINLQKRAGNSRYIPQYRATEYTYFTKTPKFDLAKKLLDELSLKFVKMDKHKMIQDCIEFKNNYSNFKHSNTENISPYRMNNSEYNISRNKIFIESPLLNKNINLNLKNNNFESNFKQNRELSPNSLLRKKQVDEKIAKLKGYGEPPPLNHIHIINKSSKTIQPYKSPLISNNTSASAANTNFKNIPYVNNSTSSVNKISSPVLNRTFVKINPVKLNFAINENFEQELDSPPLSLDLSK